MTHQNLLLLVTCILVIGYCLYLGYCSLVIKRNKYAIFALVLTGLLSQWLNLPALVIRSSNPTLSQKLDKPISSAQAAYQFTANSQNVTTSGGTAGNYINTRNSDGDYMRILTTASGLDVDFTLPEVRLWNANTLIVYYDGFVSNAALTYQIQIRDFANSTWRNIIPHNTTLANTTDNATAGLVYQAATTTDVPTAGYFEIYDGYFANGSNVPVSTPLGNFVDSSGNVKIRFYSTVNTANLELSIDVLGVQATNSPMYYPANLTFTTGSLGSGQYTDAITDDASGVTLTHSGSGLDAYFSFNNVALPYSDANTFFVEVSGNRSAAGNYSFALRDFTNNTWTALNSVALTNTTDATNYFALVPSAAGKTMANYISSSDEMRLQVSSSTTSGNTVIDSARIVIGSTHTGSGIYTATLTRGTTASGTDAAVRTIDTSTTDSPWTLNTSSTSNLAAGTEIHGDCSAAANQCTAGYFTLPVTLPANAVNQGTYTFFRFTTSNVALDVNWYVKNYASGYQQIATTDNTAAMTNFSRELSNPVRPILNGTAIATPVYQPQRYLNTGDNSMQIRFASTGSDTTARTTTIDFIFATVKTILPVNNTQHKYQATGATLTIGTNNASNYTATLIDDTTYWVVTQNGTTGTDVYLSFGGVAIPTGSNKLIVTSTQGWSGASTLYDMYLYDFTNTTWRKISPHETQFTSGTAGTISYTQLEIFDGYFSNGSNTPISTPLANFVSAGEVRLRITSASTTSALSWDYAQIQFAIDPAYFPSSRTLTTGTGTNEYNDTYTDEGTATTVTCNTSFFCFFVTPTANTADFYFSFTNVATPPEGFNSILVEYSGFKATAGTYDIQIRNFQTNAWDAVALGLNNTADATHYFLVHVGDWRDYISNGEIRIRFNSTGNANAVYVDFLQLTLGSVPKIGTPLEDTYGHVVEGTADAVGNANTLADVNEFDDTKYLTITASNNTSGIRAMDELAGKAIRFDMPFIKDPGTTMTGLIYAYRANCGNASLTLSPSLDDPGSHFRALTPSQIYTLTTTNGLPTAADTATLASASLAFRQGWFQDQIEDLWESTGGRAKFRLSVSASTTNADARTSIDFIFLSYRWVPSATTSSPDNQLRHGKFWFGGEKQKNSY